MARTLALLCDIVGCVALTVGAALIFVPAGFIVAGGCALAFAAYLDRAAR